ncbi:MAG: glycoside hydrolase family 28 protein [Ignavibacteriaceae bacterium]
MITTMNSMKKIFLLLFLTLASAMAQTNSFYNVKDFGAKGDGLTIDTKPLQEAIDKCANQGGTVLFPPGKYLTGSLVLKNNVDIYLQNGATILGSTNLKDYESHQPEIKSYNDIFLKYSIFYAEDAENISIRGEGTIDGQGEAFKVTTKEKPDRYKNRPFVFRFVECKNIKIEGITLRNSAMWMQQYLACEELYIHGIKVFNHANQNNDMMDIDGCKNVIISDCFGDTDDDGITLKSTSPAVTENVSITNCVVSSHCNAIKLGTESTGGFKNITISNIVVKPSQVRTKIYGLPNGISGITLSTVDGGAMQGVTISNIQIDGAAVPIFLRLGNRARKYSGDAPDPTVGSMKDIIIDGITAENAGSTGCSIVGIPNHRIENVSLSNIKISFEGGVKEKADVEIPELEKDYPESTMWGNLPAYGFYIRHAEGISFNNVELDFEKDDSRPAVIMDDVSGIQINELKARISKEALSLIEVNSGNDIFIRNSSASGKAKHFLSVKNSSSKNIYLSGDDFRNMKEPVKQEKAGQVNLSENIR